MDPAPEAATWLDQHLDKLEGRVRWVLAFDDPAKLFPKRNLKLVHWLLQPIEKSDE